MKRKQPECLNASLDPSMTNPRIDMNLRAMIHGDFTIAGNDDRGDQRRAGFTALM